ncbi:MAG: serine/threonine protein kinase [Polyangiaceae bacterium]
MPKHLGRYEVGAKIAGGGMATVFLGRVREDEKKNGKSGERVVALKVVKPELSADADFVEMFLDEAKIIAQLAHPNISETLEVGVSEGHRFIAMELLLGRTLADVWEVRALERKALPLNLAAWIAARVAEALHYAHEFKSVGGEPLHIIHRDVNPTNVILTYEGKVKLIDFGLVKAIGRLTRSAEGIVKGKVPYLSPEQATGAAIDRRSDIYTLGITLWEITTGKRLFKREDDVATIKAIQKAEVPDPRKDDASYPDDLWKIVQKALAVNPDDRYATAADLAAALDSFLKKGDANDLEPELVRFMGDLFPGQQNKQLEWLADATTKERSSPNMTMRPPVPVADIEADDGKSKEPKDETAPVVLKNLHVPKPKTEPAEKKSEIDKDTSEKKTTTADAKSIEKRSHFDAIPLRVWVTVASLALLLAVYLLLARV